MFQFINNILETPIILRLFLLFAPDSSFLFAILTTPIALLNNFSSRNCMRFAAIPIGRAAIAPSQNQNQPQRQQNNQHPRNAGKFPFHIIST